MYICVGVACKAASPSSHSLIPRAMIDDKDPYGHPRLPCKPLLSQGPGGGGGASHVVWAG